MRLLHDPVHVNGRTHPGYLGHEICNGVGRLDVCSSTKPAGLSRVRPVAKRESDTHEEHGWGKPYQSSRSHADQKSKQALQTRLRQEAVGVGFVANVICPTRHASVSHSSTQTTSPREYAGRVIKGEAGRLALLSSSDHNVSPILWNAIHAKWPWRRRLSRRRSVSSLEIENCLY